MDLQHDEKNNKKMNEIIRKEWDNHKRDQFSYEKIKHKNQINWNATFRIE